ncbi:alpha/beta hydrolase [Paenibacillus sp. FSL R7-0297]|uniref:alpha/beta fold hydrolase n=1 Tax=unclassified Paenibacillus TaxID=185978 RepID=UPI0004F7C576|nr:alpha/beta hydrolase [Paenibacillus sp. FSL R5-0912]AIQ40573.1 hypothetical protein R50912_11475 [Paenibacillus sp. FSL R5-0912]
MNSYFIHNESLALHVLESGEKNAELPSLLVVCGLWEPAERAIPLLSHLQGHIVAFSFRGRGLSSTPDSGYDLEDHLSDIETVVNYCGLAQYIVLGFSRGAAYSLAWSLRHQDQVRGLILVDQPPVHRAMSLETVEFWSSLVYQQVPLLNYIRREALQGMGREAREVDFSEQLPQLAIPVTLFAGRNPDSMISSDISDEVLEKYRTLVPCFTVVEFALSGHMIPDEEQAKYIAEVKRWMSETFR